MTEKSKNRKKLTDRQKKEIIAAYVECKNYSAVAKEYGVSRPTVKKLVESDPETAKLLDDKNEQNVRDILAHMDSKREKVCQFIDKYLDLLMDDEKLANATVNQLSTAFGTVIDKFTKIKGEGEQDGGGVVFLPTPTAEPSKEVDSGE